MTKLTSEQITELLHEIPDFIDKEFPKVEEGHPNKGERGVAAVAVTLFIHYIKKNQDD